MVLEKEEKLKKFPNKKEWRKREEILWKKI